MQNRLLAVVTRLLVIAAALALLTVPLAAASPMTRGPAALAQPQDDGNRAWSARPASPDGQPDGARTHYTLQGSPGESVTDYVLITNSSKVTAEFDVYATDAFNTSTGSFDLLPAARKPIDIGSWVSFPQPKVTIPAGASITTAFKVTVPANATPGDHTGGVVVSLSSGTDVRLDTRVGVKIYMRVPGNLRPVLSITYLRPTYHGPSNLLSGGSVDVTYTVENTGNIRLQSHPTLKAETAVFGFGLAETTLPDLPELLPGARVTFNGKLNGVRPAGPETITVALQPFPDPVQPVGQVIPVFSKDATIWALPWQLVLLLLLLVALIVLLVRWIRVRRRLNRERIAREIKRARQEALASVDAGKEEGDRS